MASVHVYHCLCTDLCLATSKPLSTLPQRSHDRAYITQLGSNLTSELGASELINAAVESQAIVLRLEDGFEKRYMVKCARCGVPVGYQLDRAQFEGGGDGGESGGRRDDLLYVLPGGVLTTGEMEAGKDMRKESEFVVGVAAG